MIKYPIVYYQVPFKVSDEEVVERLFLPSNSLNMINIADCFNDAQGTFEPHVFTFTSITETKQEKIWKGRQYLNDFFYDMKNEIVSDEFKKKRKVGAIGGMLIIGGLSGSSFFYSRANPETNTILPVFGITAMSVYFFEKYLNKYTTKRINERIAKVSKRIGQLEEVLRESTPIFHLIEEAQRFSQEREKTSNLVETADLGREIRDIYSHSPEMKHLNKQKGERLFDEMMN